MQRFKHIFLLGGCIAALAILLVQSTGASAASHKLAPPKTSALPASTSVTSTLFGVSALSPENIWAVGTSMNVPQFTGQPLIEHWNGTSWQIVPGPTAPQDAFNSLLGVTALSPENIWAVGFSMNTTKNSGQPLIEHWNGTSWQIVPPPVTSGSLSAITASGPDDVWAVGNTSSTSGTISQPLILHWNGNSWQSIPAATTTGNASLTSVDAVSTGDVWAVGSISSAKASKTLIEHWNGTSWQIVPAPTSGKSFDEFSGIAALSDHDIWAVGNSFSQPLQVYPFIEHWDGRNWSKVATSGLPTPFAPTTIRALSTNDLWIAGAGTLAHWNGKSWQSIPNKAQKGFNLLNALAVLARNNAWAVGFNVETKSAATLIEHWNGTSWQVISSPSPSIKKSTHTQITPRVK